MYKVYWKERLYFALMVVISVPMYFLWLLGCLIYTMESLQRMLGLYDIYERLALVFWIWSGVLIVMIVLSVLGSLSFLGTLRGNAVKVSPRQFGDIFSTVQKQAAALGMKSAPVVYVIDDGGFFNAFALRIFCRNYVVLFSEVLVAAYYHGGEDAVAFVVGHELGHHKHGHTSWWKGFLTFPAWLCVPLVGTAYSRACEYTADAIGAFLVPTGAEKGLITLAVGPKLADKVDLEAYRLDADEDQGIATWLATLGSTHPHTMDRLDRVSRQLAGTV